MELYWAGGREEQRGYYWASDIYCLVQRGDLAWFHKVFGRRLLKYGVSTKHNRMDETSSQQCLLQVLFFAGCHSVTTIWNNQGHDGGRWLSITSLLGLWILTLGLFLQNTVSQNINICIYIYIYKPYLNFQMDNKTNSLVCMAFSYDGCIGTWWINRWMDEWMDK